MLFVTSLLLLYFSSQLSIRRAEEGQVTSVTCPFYIKTFRVDKMKKMLIPILLILFATTTFAVVDRVIDPEIPIDDDFVEFETDFDTLLLSTLQVALISSGVIVSAIVILLVIVYAAGGLKLFNSLF